MLLLEDVVSRKGCSFVFAVILSPAVNHEKLVGGSGEGITSLALLLLALKSRILAGRISRFQQPGMLYFLLCNSGGQ